MRKLFYIISLTFFYFISPLSTAGAQAIIPNAQDCTTALTSSGSVVTAVQTIGQVPAWAMTQWVNGWPLITYSSQYFQLPPYMQFFTSLHECGHASMGTTDEFAANCWALTHYNWGPQEITAIRLYHQNVGALPPQYGGSGIAFWTGTMQQCPQFSAY